MSTLCTEVFNWLPLAHCIDNKVLVSWLSTWKILGEKQLLTFYAYVVVPFKRQNAGVICLCIGSSRVCVLALPVFVQVLILK